jgi:hypothetical protein
MGKGLRNSLGAFAIVLIVVVAGPLAGCATTQLAAYRDPGHASTSFRRVAVFLLGTPLNACLAGHTILPPIRAYSDDETLPVPQTFGR